MASIYGTAAGNVLAGNRGSDWIFGYAGNDFLYGYAGNDLLFGHSGIDWLFGGTGDDFLFGGSDADFLYGEDGFDWLAGGDGNDYLNGGAGQDTLDGGNGDDVMIGGSGWNVFLGGAGADQMVGGNNWDTVDYSDASSMVSFNMLTTVGGSGDAANDTFEDIEEIIGSSFGDFMVGDHEINHLRGGDGSDIIMGNGGDDWIYTGEGDDTVNGGSGWDRIVVGDGHKTIDGGEDGGWLMLYGSSGTDGWHVDLATGTAMQIWLEYGHLRVNQVDFTNLNSVSGSAYDDVLIGDDSEYNWLSSGVGGNDTLIGNGGFDRLDANSGSRAVLDGGEGDDLLLANGCEWVEMTGGAGADTFAIYAHLANVLVDRGDVMDFNRDQGDTMDLSDYLTEGYTYQGYGGFAGGGQKSFAIDADGEADTSVRINFDDDGDGFEDWYFEVFIQDGQGALTADDFSL